MSIQAMYCNGTEIGPQLAEPTLKQRPLLLLNGRIHSIFHKLQSKRFFFVGPFVRSFWRVDPTGSSWLAGGFRTASLPAADGLSTLLRNLANIFGTNNKKQKFERF
jgi:hypothetical protein